LSDVKVALPKKFCDYWSKDPLIWESKENGKCDYCPEPLKNGEEYFEINVFENEIKRGHTHHLVPAEPIEWIPKEPPQ